MFDQFFYMYKFYRRDWDNPTGVRNSILLSFEEDECVFRSFKARCVYETLRRVNVMSPKSDKDFMTLIPLMHEYPFALKFIDLHGNLGKVYIDTLCQKKISSKAELAIIHVQPVSLLFHLERNKHVWSLRAKEEIRQYCPGIYPYLFPA